MNLYLLGGRPCSGKTTTAYYLGEKHKLTVWYVDVFAQKYIDESTSQTPFTYEWKTTEMVNILQAKPEILFENYVKSYEEIFPLFLKDLEESGIDNLILEGSLLLPKFINTLKERFDTKVCYLISDDDFVKERYVQRDYVQDMLTKPQGELALKNLLKRDSIFAKYILSEIEKYSLPSLKLDYDTDPNTEIAYLEKLFSL